MIRKVSSLNFFTILPARDAPTPLIAPDPRTLNFTAGYRINRWAEVKVQFSDLLGRALVFEQEVPQTGETVEVERYRPGTGFEVGLNLRF